MSRAASPWLEKALAVNPQVEGAREALAMCRSNTATSRPDAAKEQEPKSDITEASVATSADPESRGYTNRIVFLVVVAILFGLAVSC